MAAILLSHNLSFTSSQLSLYKFAFLTDVKLAMSKLSLKDWTSVNIEVAKPRTEELDFYIKGVVVGGALTLPSVYDQINTFAVENENEMVSLDGNKLVTLEAEEVVKFYIAGEGAEAAAVESNEEKNESQSKLEDLALKTHPFHRILMQDSKLQEEYIAALSKIADKGLILANKRTIKYLYQRFEMFVESMKKKNILDSNFRSSFNGSESNWFELILLAFEAFLRMIYLRREWRVLEWVKINTNNFSEKEASGLMKGFKGKIKTLLRDIELNLTLCKKQCDNCYLSCYLHASHQMDPKLSKHDCGGSHHCQCSCEICSADGIDAKCSYEEGHAGKHVCQTYDHPCGKKCSLIDKGHCNQICSLQVNHSSDIACMCNSKIHYCSVGCDAPNCQNKCKIEYKQKHDKHDCGEKR